MPPAIKQNDSAAAAAMTAAAAAIALAEKTHETAAALAKAKGDSDVAAAILTTDIGYIKADIREIKDSIKTLGDDFVTHVEFKEAMKSINEQLKPLKNVIYGLVGLILIAVIGAILKVVLTQ